MKLRLNLWLTMFLFLMMVGSGAASAYLGYFMGREALKVVTQPELNFEGDNQNQQPLGNEHKGLKIINEKDILVKVYNVIHNKNK